MCKFVIAFLVLFVTNVYGLEERFKEKYVFDDHEVIIDRISFVDDPTGKESYIYVDKKKIYTAQESGLSLYAYLKKDKVIIFNKFHSYYCGNTCAGSYVVILLGSNKTDMSKVSDEFGNCNVPILTYGIGGVLLSFDKDQNRESPAMKFMITSDGKFIEK